MRGLLIGCVVTVVPLAAADPPAPKPKFPVGRDTTYVTGPLDKDGYIDYVAALNERLAEGVTADTNANVLIWKALGPKYDGQSQPAAFFKRMGVDPPPEAGDYFVEPGPFVRDRLGIADPDAARRLQGQFQAATSRPWTAKEFPQLADWLTVNEKPLDLVAEAAKRPHYFSPRLPTGDEKATGLSAFILSGTQARRALVSALAVRAMARMAAGKPDAAMQDVLATRRLARHFARGGNLLEGLIGYACEAIAVRAAVAVLDRPDVTAKQLAGYLKDMRALAPMPSVADFLDSGERFYFLDNFTTSAKAGAAGIAALAKGTELPAEGLNEMDTEAALRRSNFLLDRLAEAFRKPDRAKREAALDRIEGDLKAIAKERKAGPLAGETNGEAAGRGVAEVLLGLLTPPVRRIQSADDRTAQAGRNLDVAFALGIYQRENGRYPKELAELAPKYLEKVPDDLFSGKPLVYRPDEKGFLLYSVGPDGKDDGGRGPTDDPKGDDIAVRIPVPTPPAK